MANRTVKDAVSVKGTNPQYLVEKIIRTRIYESRYWKEECFALSAELLVDKAMELRYVGGIFGGNVKVTPFLCLILKMLQIQPEKDIIVEFISQLDFKYVRALGALYMRLTGTSMDCYKYLEPLYLDYRKLRRMNRSGEYELIHMDEFIDELLHEERCADIILPRIQKRYVLEESNQLDPRVSALDEDMEDMESEEEEDEELETKVRAIEVPEARKPSSSSTRRRSKSRSPAHRRERERDRDRDREHDRVDRRGRDSGRDSGRDRRDRDRGERDRGDRDRGDRDRERERERDAGRSKRRSRSRERDRGSHRDRKKSRSRSRERHRGHGERDRKHHKDSKHGSSSSKHSSSKKQSSLDQEIDEANALRAKLGMAPLRH